MGIILSPNKNSKTAKKALVSTNKVTHKARVLTPSDVQKNRSMAYTYLNI